MGRKKDRFWEHVEKQNNDRFKCNYCGSIFAGGATRIKNHLAGAKGHDIDICTKVSKEVQEEASLAIGEPNKKRKGASTSNKDKEREIRPTSISKDDMLSGVFEKSKAEYIAEILLGVFVEGLLAKLRSIVIEQHISFELGFKEGLTDLFSFLTQIQLVLTDVEKRQASDEFLRIWLAKIRYVAYDIDDVLDEFGYNILQQEVLNYSSPSNDIINMANKIKFINESLKRLKSDIASYELRAEFVNSNPEISFNTEIDSFLDDSKVGQNVGNNIVEATYCDRVTEITETFTQFELTEYDCWFIFKKRASANERLLTLDLEKIGKEIVKKCKRVPWAAEFLGRIMYFIHDKGEWLSIQNNKNWDLLDDRNNGAFHILKLGYDHLQIPSLKRCFAYCAIFPKDYNMKKDEVIQHWMAEGFLEPSKEGNTVMEDIGNTYFNILLATSFFQNARKDACGDIISCKMHNLVHDFAISISKSEILILEGDFVDNVHKVQPLFVRSDGKTTPRTSLSGDSFIKMRTLISENLDFDDMLSNFKCLRVLKLSGHNIIRLTNSIEQLIHLRLLHILDTEIEELPKSITKLYNLQTLRIEECCKLKGLPEDLSNLINLRHINIYVDCWTRIYYRDYLLKNMGRLTCLQTLNFFTVGQDDGYRIKEMGPLKNLRGEINIYILENVKDEEEAKSAKLKEKEIFKLGLFWSQFREELDMYDEDKDEKVLEGLHPHPNLKSLTIKWYRGKKFPSWVNDLSLFHNLICIKLNFCTECEEVPTLGHLPCLRVLKIFEMRKLRCIGSEFYGYSDGSYRNTTLFPTLRILELERISLEEWKDVEEVTSIGEVLVFPCLEELTLGECFKLRDLPDLLHTCVSLQKFVIQDCPHLSSLPGVPLVIQHLKIMWCAIDELPSGLQYSTSLQYLEIGHCTNLKSIPESLHTCVSLQKFVIQDCPHLRSLPGVPSVIQHLEIIRCGIDELPSGLQFCTSLQYLEIGHCTNLKSIPESLHTCISLQKFVIQDCPHLRSLPGVPSVIQHLEIIGCGIDELPRGLQFCTSLQYLEIRDCTNLKSIPESLHTCVSLQKFVIQDCPHLRSLPGVPSVIQHLEIIGCGIDELPSGLQFCTSLKYLEIKDCTNLKSIPESLHTCVSLQKFVIQDCPHLRSLPGVPSVIQHLKIMWCAIDELPSGLQYCTSLQYLEIWHCTNLQSIPESLHTCVSLQKFVIHDCPHLRSLPGVPSVIQHLEIIRCGIDELPSGLQFCTSLQYLEIRDCTNLKSIPESLHTCVSLQKFVIQDCPHLRSLPGVPSVIQHLKIMWCAIDELPSGLQYCTSLQYLEIWHCTNLQSIPKSLHTCVSLQKFVIQDCPHLSSLPGVPSVIQHLEIIRCGIDELPSGLQYCTSLQYLEIGHCTNLKSIPESLHTCISLQKFVIRYCPHLRSLPGVPSVIQHLEIIRCGIDELPSGLQFCTSLQYLEIRDCTNLKSIPESLHTCVSLQKFVIQDCPHLSSLPGVPSVIQHLEIIRCGIDELPRGLQFCTSLQYLEIGYCTNLKSIPESLHTCISLQNFVIRYCPHLRSLPGVPLVIQHLEITNCGIDELPSGLQYCTSLQYLEIGHCTNLKSIPESLHTCISLQKFVIQDCPHLRSLPGVPSVIQHLEIIGCGIDELPSGLQFCTSLQYLEIGHCTNLKSIPESLPTCVSLQKFVIRNCPYLSSLRGVPSVIQHLEIIGCGIDELPSGLQFCTSLQYLEIGDCTNLKSIPESLATCVFLQKFAIQNCPHLSSLRGVPSVIQHLKIIGCGIDELPSGLQFCTSLQYLEIRDCTNLKSIPESLHTCVSLQKFVIQDCPHLSSLPSVPSAIQHLKIIRCGIDELPSGLQFCTSLQYLEIGDCMNLQSILESLHTYVSLQKFVIQDCPHLSSLPGVPSVIQYLKIIGCGIDELPSGLQFCTSLQHLEIRNCTNLKSISESLHTCVSLQKFVIRYCPHLSSLPGVPSVIQHWEIIGCGIDEPPSGLHLCTSLQYLWIQDCPNLKSIPDLGELFHSLIKLKISNCELKLLREGRLQTLVINGLDAFPILRYPSIRSSYASLKKLILCGTPTLNSLPEEIRHFTALEELCVEDFDEMEALPDWLGIPSSLQKLSLYDCEKLMCLPILNPTNLKHLHIANCPNLKERCTDGSSEEWFKIAHVPNIRIDWKYIQGGEDSDGFDDFDGPKDYYFFKNVLRRLNLPKYQLDDN